MVLFNHATREMTAKIVYYGPGLCGKTTNLLVIYDKLDPNSRGKMLSLATKSDRTLFFDLLPVDIGKVGPFSLKLQLYTVPGQVFYNETRKLVLKGADAVVFVADSQESMLTSNRDSYTNLLENLAENQIDINSIPVVVQYNKRDLPAVMDVDAMAEALKLDGYPSVEASALKGDGVLETFKLVSKMTAKQLVQRFQNRAPVAEQPIGFSSAPRAASEPAEAAPPAEPDAFDEVAKALSGPDDVFGSYEAETEQIDDYENAEEVSLESLLEGRDRPLTFAGDVPVPELESEEAEEVLTAADDFEESPEEAIEEAPMETLVAHEDITEVASQPSRRVADLSFPAPVALLVPDVAASPAAETSVPAALAPEVVAAMRDEIAALRDEIVTVRQQQRDTLLQISDALSQLARAVRPE